MVARVSTGLPRARARISYPGGVPDSMGKRAVREAKAKKADVREARRIARNQRREDRANGLIAPGPELAEHGPDIATEPDETV
jgi:hypothetical protein